MNPQISGEGGRERGWLKLIIISKRSALKRKPRLLGEQVDYTRR